ncbi:MAG: hypothetical protein BMS9Abin39_1096 [Ignavibacteria bacterium]|nr:MAG: hypothetical protein BMS9Abin39_1096 [Ignavibacteria bacterium]
MELATNFVLNRKPYLEISIQNKEREFYRTAHITLDPELPPIMTGIELNSNEIARRFPMGFRNEVYEIESYLLKYNLNQNSYITEKIATVSLLIKNNSKILPTIIPVGVKIPIYKGKKGLNISVLCDSDSTNPQLVLYPSANNKYYDGPDLYNVAQTIYSGQSDDLTNISFKDNKYLLEKKFYVKDLIGEYELYMIISNSSDDYFFYDLGSVIFDNVAPEFDEWVIGGYYFWGNELYEGKVYLDYSIPFSRNPYEVMFSGMVYGDVKHLSINGKQIDVKKNSDILFTKEIYLEDGYKDVEIQVTDTAGNLKIILFRWLFLTNTLILFLCG